jgi:hypothetical protein
MAGCKHFVGVTDRKLKNLEDLLELEFGDFSDPVFEDVMHDLKLSLVYDPLKKVLKVSFREKPVGLQEGHVWKILHELLASL